MQDIEALKQAWLNEKFSPHVLIFEDALVARVSEDVKEQEDVVAGELDDGATFMTRLKQLELERVKYLLRSYYRTRLRKIEKFCMYILKNPVVRTRLSPAELEYTQRYVDLMAEHLNESFLNGLPEKLRDLTTQDAEDDMIPAPNFDTHVFCKVVDTIGTFQLDQDSSVDLEEGELYLLPFKPIRDLLLDQSIILI